MKTANGAWRVAGTSAMERMTIPTTCECCGREKLRRTVKMTDGSAVMWMGTGCAARRAGKREIEIKREERAAQDEIAAAERKAAAAAWQAHLDARCPEHRGEIVKQIKALGGMSAASAGYAAKDVIETTGVRA